jgi:chromosomal replication initiator protein
MENVIVIETRGVWQAVLGELELNVTEAEYKTWLQGTQLVSRDGVAIVVSVPNIFTKARLEGQFATNIKDTLSKIMPEVTTIEYKIGAKPTKATSSTTSPTGKKKPSAQQISLPTGVKPASHNLNNRYTLDSFVVGSSNDFAHAAAQAVAKNPGTKYNPLYLYGGVGLGKTHLMQAIGNEIYRQDPTKRIEYLTIESFTNEFIDAIQKKKNSAFTDKYRNVDVLIIDDMQFLAGKEKTQDEFFHTFNTLHQTNKQIIISSDKPPKQLKLEDRLISRFEMGITVDIQPPDLETRSAILQTKAQAQGVILPLEIVDFLARHAQQNIRELEGALTKVIASYEHRGGEIDLASVQRLLAGEAQQRSRFKPLTPKALIDKVAAYYDLAAADITGVKRDKEIVLPRQIAMYLMRHDLNMSYPKVAACVGGRDHTTAMHSVVKIDKAMESDELLRADVQSLRTQLSI